MKIIRHLLSLLVLSGVILVSSCEKSSSCVHGDGPIVTQSLDVGGFNGIDLSGSFNAVLQYGTEYKVEAIGQQNIIDHITYSKQNGIWKMALAEGCYSNYQLTIHITMPTINEFGVSGTGNIQVVNKFSSLENLSVFNSGSGHIFCNDSLLIANFLNIDMSASGSVQLMGVVATQNINISGSGDYQAFNLVSDECIISIPGSGSAEINVSTTLDAFISGSGNIYYSGNPVISSSITGSGSIINSN